MDNITITNYGTKDIVIWDPVFEDDSIYVLGPGFPVTYLAGTILGRNNLTGNLTGNLTAYLPVAFDGTDIPVAILYEDLIVNNGDSIFFRPIVAGRVRRADVVVHNSDVVITNAESDALRDCGIIPLTTVELAELDNQ